MKTRGRSLAKITRPVLAEVVPRKRLFRLLDKEGKKPIIWVSGPAGSGKTTLVGSYLDARKLPCIWYRLDEGDEDIASFFYYMGLAAKKAAPRKRRPLPLLTPEYLLGVPAFTTRYFEDLYGRLPISRKESEKKPVSAPSRPSTVGDESGGECSFVIVFDNYQAVAANAGFHQVVSEGLLQVPEGITIIVISRRGPPPLFSRLRANSRINLIGWDELRFTHEESTALVLASGKRISNSLFEELYQRTQGWAAGLVLLLEKAKKEEIVPGVDTNLSKLSQRSIFDYFADQIFQRTDGRTQEFLLKTAFLPKVTVDAAKSLTGISESERILSYLSREHFFTEKHAGVKSFYTYHPLFSEFLLLKANTAFSGDEKKVIQSKAASLLIESGELEEAARLYSDAGDWAGLTKLILSQAQQLIAQGRNKTLEGWLSRLPAELFENVPWLPYWFGVCRIPFDQANAREQFIKAFDLFRKKNDPEGVFLSWSGIVDSFYYAFNDFTALDRWIEAFDEIRRQFEVFPSREIEMLATKSIVCAQMFRQPHNPEIRAWVDRLISLSLNDNSQNMTIRIESGTILAFYFLWIGDFKQLDYVVNILREHIAAHNAAPSTIIAFHAQNAMRCWHHALYEDCLRSVTRVIETVASTGLHMWDEMAAAAGTVGALCKGDMAGAEYYLSKTASVLGKGRLFAEAYYYHQLSWYSFLNGNIKDAHNYMEIALNLVEKCGAPFAISCSSIAMASILIEMSDYEKARHHLGIAFDIAHGMKSTIQEYRCLLTEAFLSFVSGKEESGMESLKKGMSIGRENGYVFFDWFLPSVMSRLCEKALDEEIEVEYARSLIRKNHLIPFQPLLMSRGGVEGLGLHIENWPWPLRVYTLGRFGIEKDDVPLAFSGKVQKKPLEMLKLLISGRGREMSEVQMTDILWPEADGDTAHSAFTTTLSRLRKLIGNENAIRFQEGKAVLDQRFWWIDSWAFEKVLCSVEYVWRDCNLSRHGRTFDDLTEEKLSEAVRLTEKAFGLYKGHFLPADEQPWAIAPRERLRSKFLGSVTKLARYYGSADEWERASDYYERGLEVDDLAEEFYQGLMVCHCRLGHRAKSATVYKRCRDVLSTVLGVTPSQMTEEIYRMSLGQ